jgi:hypothetical protein
MSTRELERVEVMGRVSSRELKLKDAAALLQLSYRQVKRLWRRYREVGRSGLQHGNAGRASPRSKPCVLIIRRSLFESSRRHQTQTAVNTGFTGLKQLRICL